MLKFYLNREKGGNCEVAIMIHKDGSGYGFVNLTKCHVCKCRFPSEEAAIEDMKNDPNVISFTRIS